MGLPLSSGSEPISDAIMPTSLPISLLHFNLIFISISCILMISGYSWRETKTGVAALALGILTLLVSIFVNIYGSLYHWS